MTEQLFETVPQLVDFTVHGEPIPQGSKTRTRWGVREDNPRTKPWRATVASEAAIAMHGRQLLTGPLRLEVLFVFPRPKAHTGTGRNAGTLKASAPTLHSTKPDLDKLLRAIGDSLSGIVCRDDSQITEITARKIYGAPTRARILVSTATDPGREPA